MARAKLFRKGDSRRAARRRRVIVESPDEWSDDFLATLGALKEPLERPRAIPIARLKDALERRARRR